ncbi:MAG: hypothetical protein Q4G43_05875 [Mobilicoccus sp.]|nr:hypothetical protein [Mobilicoccus sp.]
MSNSEEAAKNEAVEIVVQRVESHSYGAQVPDVKKHLQEGLADAGVDLPDDEVQRIAERIAAEKDAQAEE